MNDPTTPAPADKHLWTVDDVAAFLRVSDSLVYKMAADGRIPSIRICNKRRFMPEQIRQWATRDSRSAAGVLFSART
jgi:excisionase family DNA binding protein